MAAYQAPPSLGFSRQEHWSGLPFPSPCTNYIYVCVSSLPPASHPSTPPLGVIQECWAELPVLHGSFPLAACLTLGCYVSAALPAQPALPFACCVHRPFSHLFECRRGGGPSLLTLAGYCVLHLPTDSSCFAHACVDYPIFKVWEGFCFLSGPWTI